MGERHEGDSDGRQSRISSATHYKGFDQFGSVTFHTGADPLVAALEGSDFAIIWMNAHDAADGFSFDVEGLSAYDGFVLSDIGSNALLPPRKAPSATGSAI